MQWRLVICPRCGLIHWHGGQNSTARAMSTSTCLEAIQYCCSLYNMYHPSHSCMYCITTRRANVSLHLGAVSPPPINKYTSSVPIFVFTREKNYIVKNMQCTLKKQTKNTPIYNTLLLSEFYNFKHTNIQKRRLITKSLIYAPTLYFSCYLSSHVVGALNVWQCNRSWQTLTSEQLSN